MGTSAPTTSGDSNSERLARWEKRTTPFIVVAALVPFLPTLTGTDRHWLPILVELVAWGVFLVDLAVHVRLRPGYLRTGLGVFDAVIVVGTFPWYLIPGLGGLAVLGLLRLARLARIGLVAFKSPAMKQLVLRLGWPALIVGASALIRRWNRVPRGSGGVLDLRRRRLVGNRHRDDSRIRRLRS